MGLFVLLAGEKRGTLRARRYDKGGRRGDERCDQVCRGLLRIITFDRSRRYSTETQENPPKPISDFSLSNVASHINAVVRYEISKRPTCLREPPDLSER